MTEFINIFVNNLVPIFIIAGAGFFLSRTINLSGQALSHVIFYIFSPCLIFNLLTESMLSSADIGRMMLFSASLIGMIGVLTWIAGKILRLEKRTLAGTMLASMFMNAGNYGLPVVLFAFGETALSYASLFFVTNAILAFVVGVVIASLGSTSLVKALVNLLKIPTLYALLLAVMFMRTDWEVPLFLGRTVNLLGSASIPAMLVLIGIQFRNMSLAGKTIPLTLATVMRMLVSPALAILFAPLFGVTGPARQASILEAAMPSAVLNTVISTQYEAEPNLVSAVVFLTTLLSPLTLTPILSSLGA